MSQNGSHHTVEDFSLRGKEPKEEVQIYTWRDATLRELTELVCHLLFIPVPVSRAFASVKCVFSLSDFTLSPSCFAPFLLLWMCCAGIQSGV